MDFLHVEGTVNVQFDWRAPQCDVAQHRVCKCSVPPNTSVTKQGRHEFRGNFFTFGNARGTVHVGLTLTGLYPFTICLKTLYYKYRQLFNISDVIDVLCTQIRIILIDSNANIGQIYTFWDYILC